jgi:hypothetical protein
MIVVAGACWLSKSDKMQSRDMEEKHYFFGAWKWIQSVPYIIFFQ